MGPVARAEDDEKSDVDVLVDLPVGDKEGAFAYFGRLEDLRRALTELLRQDVDVLTSGALTSSEFTTRSAERMRQRVLAEAVPL